MVPRLRECHRLLKNTGVFCLHLDQRSVHYARIELDKIFGAKNLINEIVWHYTNSGGRGKKTWSKKHDVILIYSKTKKYFFDGTRDGQKRQAGKTSKGGHIFEKNGKVYQQIWSNKKSYTYCLSDDKIADDVWTIQPIPPHHSERLGYPTQKPLALLNRIIKCLTNENYIIADFFCGCGTTVSAANNLGRKWLGCDISKDAIKVIRQRMAKEHKIKVEVVKIGDLSRREIERLNPFEWEKKMVEMLGGTPNLKQVGDGGIDGRMYDSTPIQVKKSSNVGRPVIDSFYRHVKNGNGKGIIIAKSFGKGAYEEVARLANEEGLQIDLVPSDDLIRDAA